MANLFIGDAYLGRRGRQKCLKMSIRYMNGPIGIIFNRLKEKKCCSTNQSNIGNSGRKHQQV